MTQAQHRLSENDNFTYTYSRKSLFPTSGSSVITRPDSSMYRKSPGSPYFVIKRATTPGPPFNFRVADPLPNGDIMAPKTKYYHKD